MIIFIKGLPGSGKTVISDKISYHLKWNVIHVDQLKSKFTKQNPTADFLKEVLPFSYKQTNEELLKFKDDNMIVEEIFRNPSFVQGVLDFCKEYKIEYHWFLLKRDTNTLI